MSPDTVSRWRHQFPNFDEMLEQAESRFIEQMTACISAAAPKDWRAAVEILARRFPEEFSRDAAAQNREPKVPFKDQHTELVEMAMTPTGRAMLLKIGLISEEWIEKNLPGMRIPQLTNRSPSAGA